MRKNTGQFQKGIIPWNKNSISKVCVACYAIFHISQSRNKDQRGKFCSLSCRSNHKFILAQRFVLTEELCELIGIIVGDGCINQNWKRKDYRIQISGNPVEDKDYYDSYLPNLIFICLGIRTKPYLSRNGAYRIQFQSEPFRIFLHSLGIK